MDWCAQRGWRSACKEEADISMIMMKLVIRTIKMTCKVIWSKGKKCNSLISLVHWNKNSPILYLTVFIFWSDYIMYRPTPRLPGPRYNLLNFKKFGRFDVTAQTYLLSLRLIFFFLYFVHCCQLHCIPWK